jgi:hypothetical protein
MVSLASTIYEFPKNSIGKRTRRECDSIESLSPYRPRNLLSGRACGAREKMGDQGNDSKQQEHVDQESGDMEKQESAGPKNH